jgi:hypothetical protein
MQGLAALIEHLADACELSDGEWRITPEELAAVLGLDQVTLWRTVYGAKDRVGFADAIDGWTQETVGDLVTVLETLYGGDAEKQLTRAGLFLPWSLGIGMIEELLFRCRRYAAAHEVRTDELESMLHHAGSVKKAVGIYLEVHLDIEPLVDECAESFRVMNDLPPVAVITAAAWLRRMLDRHVLDRRNLVVGLQERLWIAAAQLGFIDPEDRRRMDEPEEAGGAEEDGPAGGAGGAAAGSRERSRHAWARKVMGLSGAGFSAEALRARYRELMMRHHPDADPTGLERCKDVNVAYSLLISETTAR